MCLREETKSGSVNLSLKKVERHDRERERETVKAKESEKERVGSERVNFLQFLRHEGF